MKVRHLMGWGILALICIYWWWAQNTPAVISTQHDYVPLLTLTDNTTYIYAENGQRGSSLHAKYTEHHDNGNGTFFTYPELTHLDGSTVRYLAIAEHGFINNMKDTIRLSEDVVVNRFVNDEIVDQLTTDTLTYLPQTDQITTADPLVFTTPDSHTTATGALWQLDKNWLILKQNIRTHYETTTSQP